MKEMGKGRAARLGIFALALLLLASVGGNIWLLSRGGGPVPEAREDLIALDSYLQNVGQIYTMEAGILRNNLELFPGKDVEFSYDFDSADYPVLAADYGLDQVAGQGGEFDRALRLMEEFAPRLTHKSDYDNRVETRALPLLEYSLDRPENGINCRAKAQILNEMCLALGIYARKVWLMPYSQYDGDCHVVNEIWDRELDKWIMLDITNNEYWVDEKGTPLSVLEIREKGAMQEFCTPVRSGDSMEELEQLREKHQGDFVYIMKNVVYMIYCRRYTAGEDSSSYLLGPTGMDPGSRTAISAESCEKSPLG